MKAKEKGKRKEKKAKEKKLIKKSYFEKPVADRFGLRAIVCSPWSRWALGSSRLQVSAFPDSSLETGWGRKITGSLEVLDPLHPKDSCF